MTETDDDGQIQAEVSESSTRGRLLVGEHYDEAYDVLVGHLDPIDEVNGYQQRLFNLGFDPGPIDGPMTRAAVQEYQEWENNQAGAVVLAVDGIMGPKTKDQLRLRHGY